MTNQQIEVRVNELRDLIEEESMNCIEFGTLSNKIKLYSEEILKLQKECVHEFQNNICIYCGKEK